jgi:hypothetical protein
MRLSTESTLSSVANGAACRAEPATIDQNEGYGATALHIVRKPDHKGTDMAEFWKVIAGQGNKYIEDFLEDSPACQIAVVGPHSAFISRYFAVFGS